METLSKIKSCVYPAGSGFTDVLSLYFSKDRDRYSLSFTIEQIKLVLGDSFEEDIMSQIDAGDASDDLLASLASTHMARAVRVLPKTWKVGDTSILTLYEEEHPSYSIYYQHRDSERSKHYIENYITPDLVGSEPRSLDILSEYDINEWDIESINPAEEEPVSPEILHTKAAKAWREITYYASELKKEREILKTVNPLMRAVHVSNADHAEMALNAAKAVYQDLTEQINSIAI